MTQDCRNKRVRLLVRKLNKARKQQAKQIDILCHDLINAQRDFIQRLGTVRFAGSFYKSLIGISQPKVLLDTAGRCMHEVIRDACIVFFLRQSHGYMSHAIHHVQPTALTSESLERSFDDALVECLCRTKKPYMFDDMLDVGLQVNPMLEIAALAVPIVAEGRSLGLILLYRDIDKPFSTLDIEHVEVVAGGMARVMEAGRITSYDRHD
jgi:GAF domain-containing protein